MKRIIITLASIMLVALAFGQVNIKADDIRLSPRLLNYQGFVTDTLGNPINDTLDFLFRIYSVSSGGTAIWTEIQLDMIITKGIFHAALGSVTPLPDSVFTKSTNRWLEMRIAGQTMSPRTQITASGYAFTATYSDTAEYARSAPAIDSCRISANSHKLQGKDTTALDARYVNEGQAASGALTGTYPGPSLADNAVTTPKILDSAVTMAKINRAGAGSGQVIKWSGTAWQPDVDASGSDDDWARAGGKVYTYNLTDTVGIRTVVPRYALDVNGVICGGASDTVKAVYGGVLGGYSNLAGDAAEDTGAAVCGGYNNTVTDAYAFIGGGKGNVANGIYATVAGGYSNQSGMYAAVGGGTGNTASGIQSTVGGGTGNTASDTRTTVSGGGSNTASVLEATIGGGANNTASGIHATVSGGYYNLAAAFHSTVGGGYGDTTSGYAGGVFAGTSNLAGDGADDSAAVVCGGYNNSALAKYAFVGGGLNNSAGSNYSLVVGGDSNTATQQICATLVGGYHNCNHGLYGFLGGGRLNYAAGADVVVCGGYGDSALVASSFIGGGDHNRTTATPGFGYWNATIGGGENNTTRGDNASILGGSGNYAGCFGLGAFYMTIGGGYCDTAKAFASGVFTGYSNIAGDTVLDTCAVVCGGYNNAALDRYAFVGGGYDDSATGRWSFVGGGLNNTANFECGVCVGGYYNLTSGQEAALVGGWRNLASGTYAFIGGGADNTASGYGSAICGGGSHYASTFYAAIPGGFGDTILANYGFATNQYSKIPATYTNSAAFNGQAATASGQTRVGAISKASGTFTIDHPLDPENKMLNHYFVESPEMVLIYRGSVVLDASGRAVVNLPDYFDALNENPMAQVSGIGSSDVYIAEKVRGNTFAIGGKPGIEVYWTVTGARKDPSAEITKIIMPVEQPKEGGLIGRSLDDDFLLVTKAQLERMGKAEGFKFRHASAAKRYEDMKNMEEGGK